MTGRNFVWCFVHWLSNDALTYVARRESLWEDTICASDGACSRWIQSLNVNLPPTSLAPLPRWRCDGATFFSDRWGDLQHMRRKGVSDCEEIFASACCACSTLALRDCIDENGVNEVSCDEPNTLLLMIWLFFVQLAFPCILKFFPCFPTNDFYFESLWVFATTPSTYLLPLEITHLFDYNNLALLFAVSRKPGFESQPCRIRVSNVFGVIVFRQKKLQRF